MNEGVLIMHKFFKVSARVKRAAIWGMQATLLYKKKSQGNLKQTLKKEDMIEM